MTAAAMQRATILYHVCEDTRDEEILVAAQAAASKNMYLDIVLYAPIPVPPFSAYGVMPYAPVSLPGDWSERLTSRQTEIEERIDRINELLASTDVSGGVRQIACVDTELENRVSESARYADVAFFAPSLRDRPEILEKMLSGILFHSSIGAILNATPTLTANHILIAWNESPAATSAVHQALPFLLQADHVTILCVDPTTSLRGRRYEPGADLAAWLARHGCETEVFQSPSGGSDIGPFICKRATEFGADLIVMGAYGHSRMQQAVFGGITHDMLGQKELPVFLAH